MLLNGNPKGNPGGMNHAGIAARGRLLLYIITSAEGPVLRSKLLFTKRDFQQYDMPESANSGPSIVITELVVLAIAVHHPPAIVGLAQDISPGASNGGFVAVGPGNNFEI